MKLGCVVMASGEGKRFGGNKMLASVEGVPLVMRTVESVPRRFDTVVSTRWPEVEALCREASCPCVLHDGRLRSESVRAGLAWGMDRSWDGALFLPGDQPLVSAESFRALAEAFAQSGCASPVRLAHRGEPASPVLFPASMFDVLCHLEGSDGGSSLLRGRDDVVLIEVRAYELWDVDTAKGLRRVSEHVSACAYFDKLAEFAAKEQQ